MAAITLNFESFEEMKAFAKELVGGAIEKEVPQSQVVRMPYSTQIAQATQLPVQAITEQQTAQPQPTPQGEPAQQTVTSVPQQPVAQVPTTQRTYTQDELASAAMQLMDKGLQTQLQELLAGYGVEALPALPAEQFGNFATALRGLGAQI